MRIPQPPPVNGVAHLSATTYREMARCKARGAWAGHGDRATVPGHPSALLGVAAHRVIEAANRGRFSGPDATVADAARKLFDDVARELYGAAHPLLRMKFRSAEHLPFYSIYRERAASRSVLSSGRTRNPSDDRSAFVESRLVESRLSSTDGALVGHPDLLDAAAHEVIDYKNGAGPEGLGIDPAEVRQLRFYAMLAGEAGIAISRGTIVRADGRRASIDISPEDARAEGDAARRVVADYRSNVGSAFADIADPSPENCRFCDCVPFCERFWEAANPDWESSVGCHVEGVVQQVETSSAQGIPLATLTLTITAGACPRGDIRVEQVPTAWLAVGGDPVPGPGDRVRICYARLASSGGTQVVRVDRVMTAVWRR